MSAGSWAPVRERLMEGYHLASLSALALAHPVLEVVGGSPSYFVALRAGRAEAVALLVAAMVAPPAAMWGVQALAGRFSEEGRRVVQAVFMGLLAGALLVPPLHRAGVGHPMLLAAPVGVLAGVAYRRVRAARELVPNPMPSQMPAPMASMFLSAPPSSMPITSVPA